MNAVVDMFNLHLSRNIQTDTIEVKTVSNNKLIKRELLFSLTTSLRMSELVEFNVQLDT